MQIAQELAAIPWAAPTCCAAPWARKKPRRWPSSAVFEEGARQIDGDLAIKIFDLVEKFAGYGFNKSHSAAYALVVLPDRLAEVPLPRPFMAAVMSSELQNTDKIVVFVEECRAMKLVLKLPDERGQYMFTVNPHNEIIYGLGAIKGLGEGPVENLLVARNGAGLSSTCLILQSY